jgi:nitrate/nitrite-specific signal transduction histidine kinase
MSRGQWDKIENNTRFKEVSQLTSSFNQMARQLSGTLETLEQRVRERTSELTRVNKELQVEIAEHKKTEAERERLITELQEALKNVKQLTGLLPICANCKKIRDDTGYWHQVEVYVRDHSEAEFSHGICPNCMKILYPELDEDS